MCEKPVFKKIIDYEEAKQLLEQIRQDRGCPSGYKALDKLCGGFVKDGVRITIAPKAPLCKGRWRDCFTTGLLTRLFAYDIIFMCGASVTAVDDIFTCVLPTLLCLTERRVKGELSIVHITDDPFQCEGTMLSEPLGGSFLFVSSRTQ